MRTIVLATNNPQKLVDFQRAFGDFQVVSYRTLTDEVIDPVEDGTTYCENALIKAKAISEALGLPTLADDSGLSVDALGGAPGLHSKRWLGPDATGDDLVQGVLDALGSCSNRAAHYTTCLCYYDPEKGPIYTSAKLFGTIAMNPRGTNGFQYDRIFILPHMDQTLAEVDSSVRLHANQRLWALRDMADLLTLLVKDS